jgi:flagellar biosynthesis/type III secretory pathway chaperone
MENTYKVLDELLARKTRLYSVFIDVLKDEWSCVSGYSLERLEQLLEKKEELMGKIQKLNDLREKLVMEIATRKNIPHHEITLKQIVEFPDNIWSKRMSIHREKLREQIETINELNLANRNLINRSAHSNKKSMTWLYQVDAAYTPYHANGQVSDVQLASRMVSTEV